MRVAAPFRYAADVDGVVGPSQNLDRDAMAEMPPFFRESSTMLRARYTRKPA